MGLIVVVDDTKGLAVGVGKTPAIQRSAIDHSGCAIFVGIKINKFLDGLCDPRLHFLGDLIFIGGFPRGASTHTWFCAFKRVA